MFERYIKRIRIISEYIYMYFVAPFLPNKRNIKVTHKILNESIITIRILNVFLFENILRKYALYENILILAV